MRRYLLVALWPAGMAAIAAAAVVAVRRAPAVPVPPLPDDPGDPALTEPAEPEAERFEPPVPATAPAEVPATGPRPSGVPRPGWMAARLARGTNPYADPSPDLPGWRQGLLQLAVISLAGGVLAYRVMELVGRPVLKHGPKMDVPVERWTRSHQVPAWASKVELLNKVGSSWTTWAAAGSAGACLSVSWPRQKWLPPSVLASAIVVDKCTTSALRRRFGRVGPPSSPLGTYPAGGPDRVVLFTSLIANMLWREFSGSERGKALAVGAVGGLAFNMSYCREYLSRHWLTDILCGLLYGALLYAPFALAIQLIAGPPVAKFTPHGVSASVAPLASVSRWLPSTEGNATSGPVTRARGPSGPVSTAPSASTATSSSP
jgi:membrane-associated phospholipid phosphatase